MLTVHSFVYGENRNIVTLLVIPKRNIVIAIDAVDATFIQEKLNERQLTLTHLLITHKHADHTAGIEGLKKAYSCVVYAPLQEAEYIRGADTWVEDQSMLDLHGLKVQVLTTPGHTRGHVIYHFPDLLAAACGDAVFSLGCGRVFEGSMDDMWRSVQKIRALPDATTLWCGHDYFATNSRFALHVDPDNLDLQRRVEAAADHRSSAPYAGLSYSTTVALEKATNPFFRADAADLMARFGMATPLDTFTTLRTLRNKM